MSASSSTVLANLAYLIGAVVLAFIGGLIVWLRHRQPKSVDANMASFRRGLSALAPDSQSAPHARGRRPVPAAPVTAGLTHVRLERAAPPGPAAEQPDVLPGGVVEEEAGGRPG